nr:hypothetical protein [Tanacetum cinerariifolium]
MVEVVAVCRWPRWRGGDYGSGGGLAAAVVVTAREGNGVVDLIDREAESIFEVRRKRSWKSFLAVATEVAGWWWWWLEIIERSQDSRPHAQSTKIYSR